MITLVLVASPDLGVTCHLSTTNPASLIAPKTVLHKLIKSLLRAHTHDPRPPARPPRPPPPVLESGGRAAPGPSRVFASGGARGHRGGGACRGKLKERGLQQMLRARLLLELLLEGAELLELLELKEHALAHHP